MGPLFTDSVTLYHRERVGRMDAWTRTVIHGVQWKQKTVRIAAGASSAVGDGKIVYATETGITIPVQTADGVKIAVGDIFVFGICTTEIAGDTTEDTVLRVHRGVIVQSVADNTLRPRLRHRKAVCI